MCLYVPKRLKNKRNVQKDAAGAIRCFRCETSKFALLAFIFDAPSASKTFEKFLYFSIKNT